MKMAATDGLHAALMADTLKMMKRSDKRANLATLATKKVKKVERAPKEVRARVLKTNAPEVSDKTDVIDEQVQAKASEIARPKFEDVISVEEGVIMRSVEDSADES